MPMNTSPLEDGARDNKISGKHKWRGKIFNPDGIFSRTIEDQESNEEDLAHFLGNGAPRLEGQSQHSSENATTQPTRGIAALSPSPENIYHQAKPKQNKGLHVGFVQTPPEIIGEGGDEAETPSILVSKEQSALLEWQVSKPELPQRKPEREPQTSTRALERPKILSHDPKNYADEHPVVLHDHLCKSSARNPLVSPILGNAEENESDTGLPIKDWQEDSSYAKSSSTFSIEVGGNSLTPCATPEPAAGKPDNTCFSQSHEKSFTGRQSIRRSRDNSPHLSSSEISGSTIKVDSKPISLRNIEKGLELDALNEFEVRVKCFSEIFRIGVAIHDDPMKLSFKRWMRVATWWYLKGRGGLEIDVRNRPHSADNDHIASQAQTSLELKQAYVDLAKAWWIITEITPNHPEILRYGSASLTSMVAIIQKFGHRDLAESVQSHVNLVANLRALATSMKRNERLPPETLTIQGLDVIVLLSDPDFSEDILAAFSSHSVNSQVNLLDFALPLGDPKGHFTFCRMFGTGSVSSGIHSRPGVPFSCAVSLFRSRDSLDLLAVISTQEDSMCLTISTEKSRENQLTWKEVNWSTTKSSMGISITHDVALSIQLSDQDFKSLWHIYDYTRKVQKDFHGRTGERLVFEVKTYDFQCLRSTRHASSFPPNAIRDCRLKLFARLKTFSDGTGRIHAGYRLMVRTPPSIKSLSSISQDYGDDIPTLFGFSRREDRPRLAVSMPGSSAFVITFQTWEDLDFFYNTFTQRQPSSNEIRSASLPLNSLHIWTEDDASNKKTFHLPTVKWQQLKVINIGASDNHNTSTTDHSQGLRVITQCDVGIMTDCLNLAHGELQIALGVDNCNEIRLLRPLQRDLFVALTDIAVDNEVIDSWRSMLWAIGRSNVVKSYNFRSLSDLHTFETLVTGFDVVYEGVATHFAISRRRKGVPIPKRWETDFARIQILKQHKSVQLIAFFRDFSHGSCMNFVLKVTDIFETSSKANGHYLRIVDAKFALPRGEADLAKGFVCLDTPEYPAERDDITIGFHDENQRDRFTTQLPAQVSRASKMGTLKR